ncbi:MAG: 2-oxoacid:acceptor oxidoreductase family protein [Proteobacteria bacterium]|nr:2-oxoacid:acceptor oxidoreductase family protein [Pseudomonadota bacterium]
MAKIFEVTIWATGVLQDMEGRHASLLIANAADKAGKFVQAWDNYADLPDRVNVPLRKYARISDEEIEMRYEYENEHPEMVIIMQDAIIKGMNVLWGMPKGGVLVINTKRSVDDILKFIPNKDLLSKIVTVDANSIAKVADIDFMGGEGGVEVVGIGAGPSAPLVGAACKVTDAFSLENVVAVAANKDGVKKGYEQAVVTNL